MHHRALTALLVAMAIAVPATPALSATLCTVVAESESGVVLLEEGDCRTRVTPASTFKVALAAMGFESGVIDTPSAPVWQIAEGEPDYGGAEWRQPTDPAAWLEHSVLWYSQRIAADIGGDGLTAFAGAFGYGNADFSGDPGYDNGLERAWIASSLAIAPVEQVAFLRSLVEGRLPLSDDSRQSTMAAMPRFAAADGWTVTGKTGSAFPRRADRSFDRSRGWGWFVGWAERDGERLVFARLDQDETENAVPASVRARDDFIANWPSLFATLGR